MSLVTIIDYGSGNLASARKALEYAALNGGSDCKIEVTNDPMQVAKADRIILPGVGAFADCSKGLNAVDGMIDALTEVVQTKTRPFLGICVGHQLMASRGLEKEETQGLGWIKGDVIKINPQDKMLKIPHMGWNTIDQSNAHPVVDNLPKGQHAYFVHSYHMKCESDEDIIATANYSEKITAIVAKDNLIGIQFHPEKSQSYGLALLDNFLKWNP